MEISQLDNFLQEIKSAINKLDNNGKKAQKIYINSKIIKLLDGIELHGLMGRKRETLLSLPFEIDDNLSESGYRIEHIPK